MVDDIIKFVPGRILANDEVIANARKLYWTNLKKLLLTKNLIKSLKYKFRII